ncbi:MAG: hypothetical protein JHC95_21495 [Solirubrobacteraceae bacterium]|nr:hypothetical protein [Solirubrobacteraceae bacterium]
MAEPIVGWPGDSAPRLTLTNRRLIVHGTSAPEVGAHVALERIACVRAEHVSRASRFALEVLLHTPRASATLTLEGLMRRREAFVFTRALADAHRARWQTLPLGGQAEAAVDVMRPRRVRGGLSYLPALHVPLGMTDAIRGPGAPATVPQRMRL